MSPEGRSTIFRAFLLKCPARFLGVIAVVCICLGTTSCAPASHTPEPYRSDPAASAALSARAAEQCVQSGENHGAQPDRVFVSDGCSRVLDTAWNIECCVEHDIAYWCGGSREARLAADVEFGRCIAAETNVVIGWLMKTGVRMGGHPVFPSSYRWGYGHPYRPGYPSAGLEASD